MVDYSKNVHSHPEASGLKIVYEIDVADSYEFDMLLLLRREKDGALLIATDSGCSCPCPFEDVDPEKLEIATPEAVREWFAENRKYRSAASMEEENRALAVFESK